MVLHMIVKFWLRLLEMKGHKMISCYKWADIMEIELD